MEAGEGDVLPRHLERAAQDRARRRQVEGERLELEPRDLLEDALPVPVVVNVLHVLSPVVFLV